MPPLRTEEDRIAMIEAIKDGTVDIIVSSHDPQSIDKKRLPFNDAAAGAIGMETLLSAALRLYHDESISLLRLTELLSTTPAKLFGLNAGTLKKGVHADLILVDLEEPWVVSTERLYSRSKIHLLRMHASKDVLFKLLLKDNQFLNVMRLLMNKIEMLFSSLHGLSF